MMMKVTQLVTYFDASDADTVIAFIDDLRELLWNTYGDEIIAMRLAEEEHQPDRESPDPDVDDETTF